MTSENSIDIDIIKVYNEKEQEVTLNETEQEEVSICENETEQEVSINEKEQEQVSINENEKEQEVSIETLLQYYNDFINHDTNINYNIILDNFKNFKEKILLRYLELDKENKIMEYYEKLTVNIEIVEIFLKLLSIHLIHLTEKMKSHLIAKINELCNIFNPLSENFNCLLINYFKEFIIEQLEKDNVKRKFTVIIVRIFDYDKEIIYLLLKNNINPINWFSIHDKEYFQERNIITDHDKIMKLCRIQIHPSFIQNLINLENIEEKTKNEIRNIDLYKELFN